MTDLNLRREVLSQFRCPFEVHSTCPRQTQDCPFGHQTVVRMPNTGSMFSPISPQALSSVTNLRTIPDYICVEYLCGRCHAAMKMSVESVQITKCHTALHPSLEELVDLDSFNSKIAVAFMALTRESQHGQQQVTSTKTQNNATNETDPKPKETSKVAAIDHQCGICLEMIRASHRLYGLLENCAHSFCINCIVVWNNSKPESGCPTCRQVSHRILVWNEMVIAQSDRKRLFDLEQLCADLSTANRAGPTFATQRVIRTVSRQYIEAKMRDLFQEDGLQRASASIAEFTARQTQQQTDQVARHDAQID